MPLVSLRHRTRILKMYRDITQEINNGYQSQGSPLYKNWKWLRDRCLETLYRFYIATFYVITYCILSYVI
jgi:hypothetical protein